MKKYAVLTMDVEDLHHLDYISISKKESRYSMLDGLNNFAEILDKNNINGNFFVVGEIIKKTKFILNELIKTGSSVGSHTMYHKKPNNISINDFKEDLILSKNIIEQVLSCPVNGFRAPCFSLDDERLSIVRNSGFLYDSSKINFNHHPLYGDLKLNGFNKIFDNIYEQDGFYEFEISTHKISNYNLPISGGGYLRIFPWLITRRLIESYLKNNNFYCLYIHPFELSNKTIPKIKNLDFKNNLRMRLGRETTFSKIDLLIKLLKKHGFEFVTFEEVINSNNE